MAVLGQARRAGSGEGLPGVLPRYPGVSVEPLPGGATDQLGLGFPETGCFGGEFRVEFVVEMNIDPPHEPMIHTKDPRVCMKLATDPDHAASHHSESGSKAARQLRNSSLAASQQNQSTRWTPNCAHCSRAVTYRNRNSAGGGPHSTLSSL